MFSTLRSWLVTISVCTICFVVCQRAVGSSTTKIESDITQSVTVVGVDETPTANPSLRSLSRTSLGAAAQAGQTKPAENHLRDVSLLALTVEEGC